MQHQLPRRAREESPDDVANGLALRRFCRLLRAIDVASLVLVDEDETLRGHDLKQFEDAGVADIAIDTEHLMHFTNRRGAPVPEDRQDCQFGRSRAWSGH